MNRLMLILILAASLAGSVADAAWIANGPDGGNVYEATAAGGKLFIATDGGPYVSADDGLTWSRLGDWPSGVGARSIAVDPSNSQNLLAAGPSLYRSVDGGAHWSVVAPLVDRAMFHPSTPSDALGIYNWTGILRHSGDSGATWNMPSSTFIATAAAPDPLASHAFYVIDSFGQIQRSVDGGATWQRQGFFGFGNGGGVLRDPNVLAVDPAAGAYLIWTANLQPAQIRRYVPATDSGDVTLTLSGKLASGVVADPLTVGRYWVSASSDGMPAGSRLYESIDGAQTWSDVGVVGATVLASDATTVGLLYGADSRGFARSADGGRTWTSRTRGMPNAISAAVSIRPGNPQEILAAGTFGVSLSIDGGVTWADSSTGIMIASIEALARAPSDPDIVYAGRENLYRSSDGGRVWQPVPIDSYPVNLGGVRFQRIEVDRGDSNRLVAQVAGDAAVWSNDGGLNWQSVRGIDGEMTFNALPHHAAGTQRVYLLSPRPALYDRRLYRASEHGAMPVLTGTQPLAALDVYPGDETLLVALTYNSGVARWQALLSNDGGDTWQSRGQLVGAITALTYPQLRFNPCDANVIYALAGDAFYTSIDRGATWASEPLGIALPRSGSWASDLDARCAGGKVIVAAATRTGGVRVREPEPTDPIFADGFED